MKAIRIIFQRGQQEVRVTDDASVEVQGNKDWTTLYFWNGWDRFSAYVTFHTELESWEEIYLREK